MKIQKKNFFFWDVNEIEVFVKIQNIFFFGEGVGGGGGGGGRVGGSEWM